MDAIKKRTSRSPSTIVHVYDFEVGDNLARVLERAFDGSGQRLDEIKEQLQIIMAIQEEFDTKISAANTALDAIGLAVAAEAKQVADFIAANPNLNTSALDGVVARLEAVDESINTVFDADPTPPAEPPVEPTGDPTLPQP